MLGVCYSLDSDQTFFIKAPMHGSGEGRAGCGHDKEMLEYSAGKRKWCEVAVPEVK